MDKNLNCCSGLFNSDKLLIFKFGIFKVDLKDKKSFRGSNFVQKFGPY